MAELILGSVMESIAGHLLSLVSEEIGLARGVRLELEKLQGTVSIIGGVLREAEKRQVEAEDVKEWLKRLRDVAYDADDLLDDFSTEALRRGRVGRRGKQIANEDPSYHINLGEQSSGDYELPNLSTSVLQSQLVQDRDKV